LQQVHLSRFSNGRANALVPRAREPALARSVDPLRPNGAFNGRMKLQPEVRHKSEDSTDGHTVFIDRHLPKSFRWLTKTRACRSVSAHPRDRRKSAA
jgi:uncharacterized heparinase superfamily protein